MNIPILKTKLRCPSPPTKLVRRPQLMERLNDGLESGREITFVSAPAGFGKTTCISEWIDSLDLPVAWLSLDTADDDPVRFFIYFIAALKTIKSNVGQEIEAVIRSGQMPPAEIISASIINDILEIDGQFILVLDDFQVLQDNNILEALKVLLNNHPEPLHLVFITREDPPLPLARLRANNKLTEIRAKDLRFNREEIAVFINNVMGFSLQEQDIAVLEEKTEGWIAGVQLMGLSIKDNDAPSEFISKLSGSHQFILSYMMEQVLNQQSEDVRSFLLNTSILDQFNSELCDAITQRTDAKIMLQRLYKANMFLVSLDDENEWHRYHHFFTDILRELQQKNETTLLAELHTRASRWLENAGRIQESIRHALAAENYPKAIELLEAHATDILMQGYAKTVDHWMQEIPEKWHAKFPKTNLAFAWVFLLQGAYSKLSQYIDLAGTYLDENKSPSLKAEWLVMKSLILYMQGEIEACMKMAAEALETVPRTDTRILGLAYYVQAHVFLLRQDYVEAEILFRKSIHYSQQAEILVPEMMSTISLIGAANERGQLHSAFTIATKAVIRLENSAELPPIGAFIYLALGEIYYQRAQFEEAQEITNRAFQLSSLGGLNTGLIYCRILYSRLFHSQQKLDAAQMEIQAAFDLLPLEAPRYIQQDIAAQQVRIFLDQNQLDAAESVLRSLGFDFSDPFSLLENFLEQSNPFSAGSLFNAFLRTLLHQSQRSPSFKSGVELATYIIDKADRQKQLQVSIEAMLLRAQFHQKLGDDQACIADIVSALERGRPQGMIGIFVEQKASLREILQELINSQDLKKKDRKYIQSILEVFPKYQEINNDNVFMAEPLTDRELDVLLLMADGLRYKDIAAKLFISLNTVRFHVKAIYGKFGVNNKTQAIQKARQRQII